MPKNEKCDGPVMRNTIEKISLIWSDQRGVSAIEFAFIAGLLSLGLVNIADLSIYIYKRLELENATQMGAQAAWKACDLQHIPATTNCPGLLIAVTNAVHSTSLGTQVSLQAGSPTEGYYCLNSSNTLQYVSNVNTKPANCSTVGMPDLQPIDYIKITTTFDYAPLFPGVTVASMLETKITKTTLMRLN